MGEPFLVTQTVVHLQPEVVGGSCPDHRTGLQLSRKKAKAMLTTLFILILVVVSKILYFHPYLGKIPILTNILQMGWNHQLVIQSQSSFSASKSTVCDQKSRGVNMTHDPIFGAFYFSNPMSQEMFL